jgi:hypothetical protein
MKMTTFKNPSTEVFLEGEGLSITVNTWHNLEGVNLMLHGKDLSLRMAGALTWEEVDMVISALSVARSA